MTSVYKRKRDCGRITKSETDIGGVKMCSATYFQYLKCTEDFCLDLFKRLLEILMRILKKGWRNRLESHQHTGSRQIHSKHLS